MPRKGKPPRLFVIAGPNGAGKTTFARRFLPYYADCEAFVNADLIASGLSPFAPAVAAVKAGRLVLEQIDFFAELRRDFALATTLSGRGYVKLLGRLKAQGYRVSLYFLWLRSAELAISRVVDRVRLGGHYVPDEDVRRRYDRGLRNLLESYRPLLDDWRIIDNTQEPPRLIAAESQGNLVLFDRRLFELITKGMEGL